MKSKVVLLKLMLITGLLAIFACTNPLIEELYKEELVPEIPPVVPEITWTVTFDSKGGSTVPSQTVVEGDTATRPKNPVKSGNGFVNWYADSALSTLFDFDTPIMENTTLYAEWVDLDFPEGTIHNTFNVSNIDEWNWAVNVIGNGFDNKNYVINVIADFEVPCVYESNFRPAKDIKVSFRGAGRTLTLAASGTMLCAGYGQTFILWDLILQGHFSGYYNLVQVGEGATKAGTFIMQSGKICRNNSTNGGGVWVWEGGTFIMNGGEISGNNASMKGGGVYVTERGTFTMNDGIISGNSSLYGGGVYVGEGGTFTMHSGKISGNNTSGEGGGVYIDDNPYKVSGTSFTMYGGEISGNNADYYGGGIYNIGTVRIVTGTIYGEDEYDSSLRNTSLMLWPNQQPHPSRGSALSINGDAVQAEYGKLNGTTWSRSGYLDTTNNTIRVLDGVLQQ
jgi:hypothetical protein